MTPAAVSVFAWGIYMLVMGVVFLVAPNAVLPLLGQPTTSEVWVRMVAILAIALGYYYVLSARAELTPLFRWKVQAHLIGVVCMLALVVLRLGPPIVLLFAAGDAAAALWTWLALRRRPMVAASRP